MALFDPATLLSGLVKSLGISPEAVATLAQDVAREIAQLRADRAGFAQSSTFVVADFRARLDRIEAKLDQVLSVDPEARSSDYVQRLLEKHTND